MEEKERVSILAALGGKKSGPTRKLRRNEPHMIESRKRRANKFSGNGNPMFGSNRLGEESPNLRHIFVTPNGRFFGMGEAIKANPGIPIRGWCLGRTDKLFTQFKKSQEVLGFTKEQLIGKTPRDLGYYTIQYANQ